MIGARRIVGRESFWPGLGVAGFVASVALQAVQSTVPEDHSAYFGGWTLNRELSSIASHARWARRTRARRRWWPRTRWCSRRRVRRPWR